MIKIGIIFCAFNCAETIEKCLAPWKQADKDSRFNFKFSCVSVPFEQYKDVDIKEDNTLDLIKQSNLIEYLIEQPKYISEIEARGYCLQFLKVQGCDFVWMVDGDEIYTIDQINAIVEYVKKNQETAWFKIALKNFIFDEQTYLTEPFCPPRIYRVSAAPFALAKFYQDNDISYLYCGKEIPNFSFKNKTIPASVANPIHLTWLNNEKSKLKIDYQKKRWGVCSYRWNNQNEEGQELEFDPEYYQKQKLPIPEVIKIP